MKRFELTDREKRCILMMIIKELVGRLMKGKIKYAIILLLMCYVLFVRIPGFAKAENLSVEADGYIVKIVPPATVSLFSTNECIGSNLGNRNDTIYIKDEEELQKLQSTARIKYIEPNYKATLCAEPTDELYTDQKNLSLIDAKAAWYIGCYGKDIRVGVIDSGANAHIDLAGNLLPGYNCLLNNYDTKDNVGHGTAVAGVIAAECNSVGVVGVAYKAKIVPIKCFDTDTETYLSHLIEGIYVAVDEYQCDIINFSGGIDESSQALDEAVDYAAKKGVIIIAAVGNGGVTDKFYPASSTNTIGVGSVNNGKALSSFSRRNDSVFVVAQGEYCWLLKGSDAYDDKSRGTSYSAPHVAGAAAIAKCIDENLDVNGLKTLLIATSEDLGTVGYDTRFGYGLINIGRLVDKMLEDTELFVSQIDVDNLGNASIKVYNNMLTRAYCNGIWADYNGEKLQSLEICEVEFDSKTAVEIKYMYKYNVLQYMLWDSAENMIPLYKARRLVGQ